MSTQPKALKLADALENSLEDCSGSSLPHRCQKIADEAATELRLQHALNHDLLEALKEILNCDKMKTSFRAVMRARAAMLKARETI